MSKDITVYHYEAFSRVPGKGNPAGVVMDAEHLSDDEMLEIAQAVGFNESVFVLPSHCADLQLRYFTPGHEMNLCGHATMASLTALCERGFLADYPKPTALTIETKAGILPILIDRSPEGDILICMEQAPAQFTSFEGDREKLAGVLGLESVDIATEHPIVYGSTGIWTLVVPLMGLDAMRRLIPDNDLFPQVLEEMPRASIHLFCLETYDPGAQIHGRHFSSPFSGTIEDPVTGTASGVLGAYFLKFIREHQDATEGRFVVEQGQEIGKDGRVIVEVTRREDALRVNIFGTACYVGEIPISIE
jgi:trans-2,3-dihydro-3-hydroxyanthranilate isomerase